jgi:DNA repair exonuclease SbcCD nuclease subunit
MSNGLPYARMGEHGITDRLQDQRAMWAQLRDYAVKEGIGDVWVLGDLFDKALLDAVTLHVTVEALVALAKEDIRVVVLPGNHDATNIKGERFTVEMFAAMARDGIEVVRTGEHYEVMKGVRFWAMDYAPIERNRADLERIRKDRFKDDRFNVLLMHNSVLGAKHLGWTCDDGLEPEEAVDGFDYVLSGHFHTPQKFHKRGRYLGAPMQHNFGDCDEVRGFWDITFTPGEDKLKVSPELVQVKAPSFHAFTVKRADELEGAGDKEFADGDYVRFNVHATAADWQVMLPKARALCTALCKHHGVRASYKHKTIYHHEARMGDEAEAASHEEMVGSYVDTTASVHKELDPMKLKELGRGFLEEARRA